jgi:hypothetical protein
MIAWIRAKQVRKDSEGLIVHGSYKFALILNVGLNNP